MCCLYFTSASTCDETDDARRWWWIFDDDRSIIRWRSNRGDLMLFRRGLWVQIHHHPLSHHKTLFAHFPETPVIPFQPCSQRTNKPHTHIFQAMHLIVLFLYTLSLSFAFWHGPGITLGFKLTFFFFLHFSLFGNYFYFSSFPFWPIRKQIFLLFEPLFPKKHWSLSWVFLSDHICISILADTPGRGDRHNRHHDLPSIDTITWIIRNRTVRSQRILCMPVATSILFLVKRGCQIISQFYPINGD